MCDYLPGALLRYLDSSEEAPCEHCEILVTMVMHGYFRSYKEALSTSEERIHKTVITMIEIYGDRRFWEHPSYPWLSFLAAWTVGSFLKQLARNNNPILPYIFRQRSGATYFVKATICYTPDLPSAKALWRATRYLAHAEQASYPELFKEIVHKEPPHRDFLAGLFGIKLTPDT